MNEHASNDERSLSPSEFARIDQVCDDFELRWRSDQHPMLEHFVVQVTGEEQAELFERLLELELHYLQLDQSRLASIDFAGYRRRFPQFSATLDRLEQTLGMHRLGETQSEEMGMLAVDSSADGSRELVSGDHVGRYVIERKLDAGSFGTVYLGIDRELDRKVAIKVAHQAVKSGAHDMQLLEARLVARFDHPHIVPVYDLGRLSDGRLFFISKFIDGSNLKSRIRDFRDQPREAARLMARIAQALDYAHQRYVFHRDVKPANILLDQEERPYLADFGLALLGQQREGQHSYAGTPAYMSPEQARGESHRVDRRSDVFSLAAVLYELTTAERAFPGTTRGEVLQQVRAANPRPPGIVNVDIPTELERIIGKGLRRRAGDRYDTAAEMAADLLAWCEDQSASQVEPAAPTVITPRGLNAYHETDATFFLRLIPGPRTREGLPESLDFWKQRIESRIESKTFRVGVLYGTSGSGKSSFVTAGLQPRLRDTLCLNVPAAPGRTSAIWLQMLRDTFPQLHDETSLVDAMRRIRNGLLPPERKLLVTIDQFEQWLSLVQDIEMSQVVSALRQCDGVHTQALLLVRDDFWAPLTSCLRSVDVELDASNSAMLDAFEAAHARNVLLELGRGYGAVPENSGAVASETEAFLDEVVQQVAQTGPLIPVRIALFAHAFHDRAWTLAQLHAAGGFDGVIGLFLDSITRQDPWLSSQQQACTQILSALLPPPGKLIKDRPRSIDELSELARVDRSTCQKVLRTLEVKYPVVAASDASADADHEPQYQLAHDYLVPIVRDWTARKLGATYRGRLERMLIERTTAWEITPSSRALPSPTEWLGVLFFGRGLRRGPAARRMMRAAHRWYLTRVGTLLLAALMLTAAGWHAWQSRRADEMIERLLNADPYALPPIVAELATSAYVPHRLGSRLVRLKQLDTGDALSDRQLVNAQLGMLSTDPAAYLPDILEYMGLCEGEPSRLAAPSEIQSLVRVITPYQEHFASKLWGFVKADAAKNDTVLRSACVLAVVVPGDPHWAEEEWNTRVASALIAAPAVELATWSPMLAHVGRQLVPSWLSRVDAELTDLQREGLAYLLAEHATVTELASILPRVNESQLAVLIPRLRREPQAATQLRATWKAFSLPQPVASAPDEVQSRLATELQPYEGDIAGHAAFAFAIPRSECARILSSLGASGFYPLCYRPYQSIKGERVAIGWRFGATDYDVVDGLLAEELETRNLQLEEQGWRMVDITCYESPQGKPRFAALWWKSSAPSLNLRLSLDKTAAAHQIHKATSERDGFFPARCCLRYDELGRSRRSTIWLSAPSSHSERFIYSNYEQTFRNDFLGYLATDIQLARINILSAWSEQMLKQFLARYAELDPLLAEAHRRFDTDEITTVRGDMKLGERIAALGLGLRYQGAWADTDETQSRMILAAETTDHVTRGRKLLQAGWWPHALSARTCDSDHARYASIWHQRITTPGEQIRQANAAANMALGLAEVGSNALFAEVLRDEHGRQARTFLLDRLHWFPRLYPLVEGLLLKASLPRSQMNLLLGLTEYESERPSAQTRRLVVELANASSPEISSAARYAARRLGLDLPAATESRSDAWSVNSLGQVMIHVAAPADERTLVGAPCWDPDYRAKEIQHFRPLKRDYALSATEVTKRQMERFLDDPRIVKAYGEDLARLATEKQLEPDCPQTWMTYIDGIRFCQWLSEREGLPEEEWCYPGVLEPEKPEYQMPADILERTGYRLPTEAEFEYACRAGSSAARPYGPATSSLRHYGWYRENAQSRVHVVAGLRPNEWGFFDLLGNASEWCHDAEKEWLDADNEEMDRTVWLFEEPPSHPATPSASDTGEQASEVNKNLKRAARGGWFDGYASELRSAYRVTFDPATNSGRFGFRVARTLPPDLAGQEHPAVERLDTSAEATPASPPHVVGNQSPRSRD